MITLDLRIRRSFLGIPYTRRIRRDIPSSWDDLSPDQRSSAEALLRTHAIDDEMPVLAAITEIPLHILQEIPVSDITELRRHMAWLSLRHMDRTTITSLHLAGQIYRAPAQDYSDVTAMQFAIAEEINREIDAEASMQLMAQLLITLYRPADTPVISRDQIIKEVARIGDVDTFYYAQAITLYQALDSYIMQTYERLFRVEEADDSQGVFHSSSEGVNQGWRGVFHDLAKEGPYSHTYTYHHYL